MGKYRHIGIKVFIFLIILPFLMITDFYPFMRFGMFAEPIRNDRQLETFQIVGNFRGKIIGINTSDYGLSEGQFNYMSRNYYYSGRPTEILVTFWDKIHHEKDTLYLLKITGPEQKDTALVAKYSKK